MRPSYRLAAFLLRSLFRLTYRLDVVGLEQVPLDRPLILAANHQSNLDPPLIGAFYPREISFVAKKQLFARAWMARLLHHFNAIPIDRAGVDRRAIRAIRSRLEEGRDLIVFPEGTRSKDGRLGRPRAGLGMIVGAAEADVLPVLVLGSRLRPGLPGFRPTLRLQFGTVIARASLPLEGAVAGGESRSRSARAEALTAAVFGRIEAMHAAATRS
ncbi:MAG: lysophospholipid acyltransferase family protein [bacterium]|nr:lysophospholipid acyltransferase family protein [bacterium]